MNEGGGGGRIKGRFYPGDRHRSRPAHCSKRAHPLVDSPPPRLPKKRKKEKKQSINKRTVAQIGEGMSRFSMGFSAEGTRGRNLLLLSVVQMGLMSPELEALLVIGVLISCEN